MVAVKLLTVGSLLAATTFGVVLLAGEESKPSQVSKSSPTPLDGADGTAKPEPPAVPQRQNSDVGNLLNRLDQLKNNKLSNDEWASVLRKLIEMGPQAVPELVAELDATDDYYMQSSCAFALRGIGDRRAVPGLIRALPKACIAGGGSDMFFIAKDVELVAFIQKHDCNSNRDEQGNKKYPDKTRYFFGQPITEIGASLEKLTGQIHGEKELMGIKLLGTPRQQHRQRLLYQQCAERWAKWWDAHTKDYTHEKEYWLVKLAPLAPIAFTDEVRATGLPQDAKTMIHRHPDRFIESVRNPDAKNVFLDFYTGRTSGLPKHLKAAEGQPERLDDILAWAAGEGFDLMGTEYKIPGSDKPHFVLRGLGLATWQIKTDRWKTFETEIRGAKPFDMGTRTDGLLANYDQAKGHYLPEETATFLFQTREGGFGAIFVGVEVDDTNVQPNTVVPRDPARNPVAFRKGRRFDYTLVSAP
jgi:hypothetical protein